MPENRSEDDYAISISWNVEDVKRRAKEMEITTEHAKEILDCMEGKHDAEVGISWTTIDCFFEELN